MVQFTSFSKLVLIKSRLSATLTVWLKMEHFPFSLLISISDKLDLYIFERVLSLGFSLLSQTFSFSFLWSCCCIISFLCPFCFLNIDFSLGILSGKHSFDTKHPLHDLILTCNFNEQF